MKTPGGEIRVEETIRVDLFDRGCLANLRWEEP